MIKEWLVKKTQGWTQIFKYVCIYIYMYGIDNIECIQKPLSLTFICVLWHICSHMCDLWGQDILEGRLMYTHPSVSGTAGQNLLGETIFSHCRERRATKETAVRRSGMESLPQGRVVPLEQQRVDQRLNPIMVTEKKTRCHRHSLRESPLAQPWRYVTLTDTFTCLEGQ